jgi:Icc-related predicted phosphoesterase
MIRVAAVGDVHAHSDVAGELSKHWARLDEEADVLLLAGDLTRIGEPAEAMVLVKEMAVCSIPKVAVLGNHDYHQDRDREIREILEEASVTVLEGSTTTVTVGDERLGIAGTKGFGGGFIGACAAEFGEPQMKAFVRHTKQTADELCLALGSLNTDIRIALLHYSPVEATLEGEPLEIFPFLGSSLLAQAIDDAGADLVLHGHAHAGSERGMTPGGIPVRNVALPVIRHAYQLFDLPDTS